MLKKILIISGIIILLILLVLGVGLWWGINKVNSPEFRQLIIAKITESTGVNVEIDRLHVGLFGMELDGISIPAVKSGMAGEKFLSVRAVKASYSPFALLGKPLMVAKIEVDTPVVIAQQDAAGTILLPFAKTTAPSATVSGTAGAKFAFSLPEIVVHNMQLMVYANDLSVLLSVENADLQAAFAQQASGPQAHGVLKVHQLTAKPGITINDATIPLSFGNNRLTLAPVQAGFYHGTLAGNISLNLGATPTALEITATVSGADLSLLLANLGSDPSTISGNLDAHFTGIGNLDEPKNLSGQGDLLISGPVIGKLKSYQNLTSIIGTIGGISVLKEGRFDNIKSTFAIAEQKIQLTPLEVNSPNLSITLSGPVGFDNSLDLKGEITLAPGILQVAQTVENIIGFVNSLKNSDAQSATADKAKTPSQIKLPLTVSGSTDNPKITLNNGNLPTMPAASQQEKSQSLFNGLSDLFNRKPTQNPAPTIETSPAPTNPAP